MLAALCLVTMHAAIITAATAPGRERNLSKIPMRQHHGPSVGPLHRLRPRLIQAAVIEAIAPCRMRHTNHPKFAGHVRGMALKRTAIPSTSEPVNSGRGFAPPRAKRDSRVAEPPNALPARHGGRRAPHSEADAMRCNRLLEWIRVNSVTKRGD